MDDIEDYITEALIQKVNEKGDTDKFEEFKNYLINSGDYYDFLEAVGEERFAIGKTFSMYKKVGEDIIDYLLHADINDENYPSRYQEIDAVLGAHDDEDHNTSYDGC